LGGAGKRSPQVPYRCREVHLRAAPLTPVMAGRFPGRG